MSDWLDRRIHGPATSVRLGQVWCFSKSWGQDHEMRCLVVGMRGEHRGHDSIIVVWFGQQGPPVRSQTEDFLHSQLDHVHEPEDIL